MITSLFFCPQSRQRSKKGNAGKREMGRTQNLSPSQARDSLPLRQRLSGPNGAMQPRCAMRFESHIPKSLAMRKAFFASDAKTHSLDLKSQENARKKPAKILRCWPAMRKIGVVFKDRAMRNGCGFGLPLRFGLRCEHPRCQIASDVDRAMRATKGSDFYHPKNLLRSFCNLRRLFFISGGYVSEEENPRILSTRKIHPK